MCRQPEYRRQHMECACYFDAAPLVCLARDWDYEQPLGQLSAHQKQQAEQTLLGLLAFE